LENTVAGWRFLVQNETNNLEPQDLAALTEPFWRKDSSRTDRNRSGLGLALSHALAQRIGMRLSFELDRTTLLASLTCSAEQLELPAANAADPKPLSKAHDSA
jgi:light-regulated signal transduction histidine kinase (bacteriophytochrome)